MTFNQPAPEDHADINTSDLPLTYQFYPNTTPEIMATWLENWGQNRMSPLPVYNPILPFPVGIVDNPQGTLYVCGAERNEVGGMLTVSIYGSFLPLTSSELAVSTTPTLLIEVQLIPIRLDLTHMEVTPVGEGSGAFVTLLLRDMVTYWPEIVEQQERGLMSQSIVGIRRAMLMRVPATRTTVQ
jgi:hypothetical protein